MTRKAAIIGGGVIGGGWAARFLLNGWNVSVFDPDPQAERKISEERLIELAKQLVALGADKDADGQITLNLVRVLIETGKQS